MGLRIFIASEKMTPEDASSHGEHHAFVFDGLGGAGGKLRTADDGRQASEAKAASNAAAAALDALVERRWSDWADSLDFSSKTALEGQIRGSVVGEIGGAMSAALEAAAKEWNAPHGKFPTTIAGWLTFPAPEGTTLAVAVWAGDSRCYTIDANCMKLYSQDDAAEAYRRNAMEDCIYKDSLPMNNRLGRDLSFTLHCSCHIFQGPILLLSCSDGFYHCSESPMHFEVYLRKLGAEESFEAMQKAWTDFVLEDGRFEDDSATLETIFIHTDPDDVEALGAMLWKRLDKLEQAYITPFEEKGEESYLDIDARIGTMVKRLCAEESRYHFLEELRANAIRLAMEDSELPADMPCALAVRQMRSEYLYQRREWKEKRADLEARKAQAEKALDERIQTAHTLDPDIDWKEAKPSLQVSSLFTKLARERTGFMSTNAQWEIADTMLRCAYTIQWYMLYLRIGEPWMYKWEHLEDEAYRHAGSPPVYERSWGRYADFPRNKPEAFQKIQQCLIDQCALASKLAEFNQIPEKLTKIQTGTPKAYSKELELTKSEKKCLKEALIRAADNESLNNSEMQKLLPLMKLNALEMTEISMHAAEYVRARRELENFDQGREPFPEPSAQPFDDYLKYHRNADARYLIERWLEEGERPDCFSLSADLNKVFEKNVRRLRDMKAENESIQKKNAELRSKRISLWEKYRSDFEAYNRLYVLKTYDELFASEPAEEPEFTSVEVSEFTLVEELGASAVEEPEPAPAEGPTVKRYVFPDFGDQDGNAVHKIDDDEDIETKNMVAAFMQKAAVEDAAEPERSAAQGTAPATEEGV